MIDQSMQPLPTGLLLNPRLSSHARGAYIETWIEHGGDSFDGIGVLTSGTTSGQKTDGLASIVALSSVALNASALAVNRHLLADDRDVWGLTLPKFHVGGYGILVRAALSKSRVVEYFDGAWSSNPSLFHQWLVENDVTLLSLVPTQVFDLVRAGLPSPSDLRAVVVGGGRLDETLERDARKLGWPLLKSYGMTECASQIATENLATANAPNEENWLPLLEHVEAKVSTRGRICLRSAALFSFKLSRSVDGHWTMARAGDDGWFETSDRGSVRRGDDGQTLIAVSGRDGDVVKVVGELVDLASLRSRWLQAASSLVDVSKTWLLARPDPRRGHEVILVHESGLNPPALHQALAQFHELSLPFERVTSVVPLPGQLPRSPLGKVLESELIQSVQLL